jgi:hypothetical protein
MDAFNGKVFMCRRLRMSDQKCNKKLFWNSTFTLIKNFYFFLFVLRVCFPTREDSPTPETFFLVILSSPKSVMFLSP